MNRDNRGLAPLPQLELGEADSQFDEALIVIDGHEEETIRVECPGAAALAARIVAIVNNHAALMNALQAATHALRAYEFGNGSSDLARSTADHCETIATRTGAVA